MKFNGPVKNGTDWANEDEIFIEFESVDELKTQYEKYIKSKHLPVRTSTEARPGDKKTLTFKLPDNARFSIQGEITKVKPAGDKPHTASLFKMLDMKKEHFGLLDAAMNPPASDELDLDDGIDIDLSLDEELPKTAEPEPSEPAAPKAPSVPKSAEDEAAIQAFLVRDAPEDEELVDAELPAELEGAGGDLLMPKKEGEERDPDLEIKKYIVAFILSFTKSVQRSGYYEANHPEALAAKKGLYALFRKILGRHREVNFIRKAVGDEKDILIDGVLEDMVTLREIMPQGMAEMYIPRFMEYLDRRCLISFSIKRTINEDKFDKFIDLMSRFSSEYKDDARKEGERFTKTLLENGIVEVSAIFDEDIISSGRKMPWQAELTLSRLKKDLKTVPLLKNATEEELKQIKIRIFEDTIRPLRNPSFLIAVLLNADLIMEEIEDNPVLADIDVVEFMILGSELTFLAQTSNEFTKELDNAKEIQKNAELEAQRKQAAKQEAVLTKIMKRITQRLVESNDPSVFDTLEEYYHAKVVPFEDLPKKVQDRITAKKLTDAFMTNHEKILERFGAGASDKEFSDFIYRFQRIVPQLAERGEYALVSRIIDKVRRHLDDRNARRKSLAKRFFDFISTTDVVEGLREGFVSPDKELRNLSAGVLVSFGRQSVPVLLDILKNEEDKWVRKLAIRSITEIGQDAVQPMINELYKEDNPWFFLRNLVNMLSSLGDRKIVGKLTLLLFHEHPAVREETVNALFKISPDTAESHLIKVLDDSESKVREKAVLCLGLLKSQNDKVIRYYMDVIEGKVEEDNKPMQVAVFRAIGSMGDSIDENRRQQIEEVMLTHLEKAYGGGLMSVFKQSTKSGINDSQKMAMAEALGKIGVGKRVRRVLEKIAKEKDPILAGRGQDALKLFDKRANAK